MTVVEGAEVTESARYSPMLSNTLCMRTVRVVAMLLQPRSCPQPLVNILYLGNGQFGLAVGKPKRAPKQFARVEIVGNRVVLPTAENDGRGRVAHRCEGACFHERIVHLRTVQIDFDGCGGRAAGVGDGHMPPCANGDGRVVRTAYVRTGGIVVDDHLELAVRYGEDELLCRSFVVFVKYKRGGREGRDVEPA